VGAGGGGLLGEGRTGDNSGGGKGDESSRDRQMLGIHFVYSVLLCFERFQKMFTARLSVTTRHARSGALRQACLPGSEDSSASAPSHAAPLRRPDASSRSTW